jgi:hypothetical protein
VSGLLEPHWEEVETLEGVPCPRCNHRLTIVYGDASLDFRCDQGHISTPSDLSKDHGQAVAVALQTLLECWEQTLPDLIKTCDSALAHGYSKVVEIFDRRVLRVRTKVGLLRQVLSTFRPEARP